MPTLIKLIVFVVFPLGALTLVVADSARNEYPDPDFLCVFIHGIRDKNCPDPGEHDACLSRKLSEAAQDRGEAEVIFNVGIAELATATMVLAAWRATARPKP